MKWTRSNLISDLALLNTIRQSKRRSRLFDALTAEQKREFIKSLEGSDWHLDDLLEDFVEYCREGVLQPAMRF